MEERFDEIEQRVKEVIKRVLQVNEENIKRETTIAELGGDSLAVLGILSALEQEFDITIPDDNARQIESFASAVKVIRGRLNLQGT